MTDPQYIVDFASERCTKEHIDLVGGKNASLGELMEAGENVQVPPGVAVTTAFYDAFLEARSLDEYIADRIAEVDIDDDEAVAAASREIRDRITNASLPSFLAEELQSSWERLQERTRTAELQVAVRSSATAEDLPDASFAGQQDTYLNVTDLETVTQRTKECMASLFTERAITYRAKHGFDRDEVRISVGIQKMVEARSSGVMFTVNPANGDRSKVRIESNWGLGEAVVSGIVTPDSFLVDKPVYKIVDRNVPEKDVMTVPTDAGTEEVDIDDDKRDVPSVTADELIGLTDLATTIEDHYDEPQDIEWAIEGEGEDKRYFILQSRPETAWEETGDDGEATDDGSEPDSAADQILDHL
ncbi:pyruvate, water dikinase [Halopenitus malekzadehii]|uniref:Probable phosphoenolpyruvate synthase n=1 Tax=Halopenitus malekzadehii TaxID=1267564 RepID=A0A1H6K4N2_9EURY|nr:PEP/pyruvate-binding domain-containing protein [Halopenitus malekzadehii]SEH67893.1 pyruvate, water dikinase [Halopenitus malekzadehii]